MRLKKSLFLLLSALVLSMITSCGGGGGNGSSGSSSGGPSSSGTPTASTLLDIGFEDYSPSIAFGTSEQLTAVGQFQDSSNQNITEQNITPSVTWRSSNVSVATVSDTPGSAGLVNAIAPGTTTITTTLMGVSGSFTLTVTPATLVSIDVGFGTGAPIAAGTKQQFMALGSFSDNSNQNIASSVTWSSSNVSVATVSNTLGSTGLVNAIAPGSTTITATLMGVSGSFTLTVVAATNPQGGGSTTSTTTTTTLTTTVATTTTIPSAATNTGTISVEW